MIKKLFDKTLDFELNLIGYKNKGESIVFFLRADDKVIYSGLVDCYEEASENVALMLLENENLSHFDFVCWTHPHDDHTVGMDRILSGFCNEKTLFWLPPYVLTDIEKCSLKAQGVYDKVFQLLKSKKKSKINIREAADATILEKFECCGNITVNPYVFEIRSFAPDTNLLGEFKVAERFDNSNIYSIGLVINIGHFYIILAGDVEDRTLKFIPEFNFDIKERVDYVKIPHHSSPTAGYLVDKFNRLNLEGPVVAATTVYRIHGLPNKEILNKYTMWGKNIEVYSTGNIEDAKNDKEKNGIVKTTFDILEKKKTPIETVLYGNAVSVN